MPPLFLPTGLRSVVVGLLSIATMFGGAFGQDNTDHGEWPFQPPTRPELPIVADDHAWVHNPIDRFILNRLEHVGLTPNRRADRLTLLRRVTFDLTGLPPTEAQCHAFLADNRPDAYERLVDGLLNSPRFGERWAQHWLDVVRYAESDGFKADALRPWAFQYRDYVIDSVNQDRPYDEFLCQQLAGDELEPDNPQALIATGLNRLYPDEDNAANLFQRREEILSDITETTGLALMGLTMGCAQCHDHKFDEIMQTDYYRLRAFFAGIVERDDEVVAPPDQRSAFAQQTRAWEAATAEIRLEMESLVAQARKESDTFALSKFRKEIRDCVATPAAERTPLQEQVARFANKQVEGRFDVKKAVAKLSATEQARHHELTRQLAEFDYLKPKSLPRVMSISDVGPVAPPTYVFANGNWQKPEDEVTPGFPKFLGDVSFDSKIGAKSAATTGRRSTLAHWLTQKDHPLTARVIVNRLWQHHFGQGIVRSPNDFGVMGEPPTHPELLDWLAVELTESDWSLKHIHRLMVTSATYCQTSLFDAAEHQLALRRDSENELLWHMRRRRLDGETLRDAILSVSGQVNFEMFGTSARPALPSGVSERYAWKPDDQARQQRRSIYVFVKRNMRFPLFDAFDWPDLHQSCGARSSTITPQQSLLLLNSDFCRSAANAWATELTRADRELPALVADAYQRAFARPADNAEVEAAVAFVEDRMTYGAQNGASGTEPAAELAELRLLAVADFCHALLNANEFLYVD